MRDHGRANPAPSGGASVIQPVPVLRRAKTKPERRRCRMSAAWPRARLPDRPRALVQLEAFTFRLQPGSSSRQFTAYCRSAAGLWPKVPTAPPAPPPVASCLETTPPPALLDKLRAEMPFPVAALQVDGGSEFVANWRPPVGPGIELLVLPPKSPELNCAVDRADGSWRYQFYAVYDLPDTLAELDPLIDSFQHLYNQCRPHGTLQGLSPAQ